MGKIVLDKIDKKILMFLLNNARMPFLEIARECGISGAAIHQRVKKLDDAGVILGSRLDVDPRIVGFDVCAFVGVRLSEPTLYTATVEALKQIHEVVECHFVTGKHSLLLKIYCYNHDHLMDILINTIQNIPCVQQTETLISLDQAIERQVWVKDFNSKKK
jgi:Lrp/AsnC family transcriptional regulator for asnA, asnC and gidA